jgi:hypothetical protein
MRTEPANQVNELVRQVNALTPASNLAEVLRIGELVYKGGFGGNPRAARSRGKKALSFRSIASHPELQLSAASLWRAVAAFQLAQHLPELAQFRHLGIGHVSVVLGLPADIQIRLLLQAEQERWTRASLRQAAARLRPEDNRRRRGTPPSSLQLLRSLASSLKAPLPTVESEEMTLSQKQEAQELLGHIELQLSQLRSQVQD